MITLGPKASPIEALENEIARKRTELVERLLNSGLTPEQAENVAGACTAYGKLDDALAIARKH
jgi:hypothetical protein